MKKILLIPTYHYLSNPLYTALYELLKEDYKFIYFFSKDSTMISGNLENISYEQIGYIFDDYVEVSYEAPWIKRLNRTLNANEPLALGRDKVKNTKDYNKSKYFIIKVVRYIFNVLRKLKYLLMRLIRYILKPLRKLKYFFIKWKNMWSILHNIQRYAQEFKSIIKNVSPDIIIMTSDMTISYRVIKRYFPNIQIVIIQPCFLDFREKEKKIFSNIRKIQNLMIGNILHPKQQYFGMENTTDKLLLIEDRFLNFYKNKRDNIYKVINPYYYKLNKDIHKLQTPSMKKNLLNKLKLNIDKKVIIVFISDYTLIHGKQVQAFLEKTYTKIINTYAEKYNFIIKNHPRAGVIGYENNFKHLSNICFIQDEISYLELLSLGDLNISINSNASLEAIVSGMVTLNFLPLQLKDDEHYKWLTYYGGINVSIYSDIEDFLNVFDNQHQHFINDLTKSRKKLIGEGEECKEELLTILNGCIH